VPILIKEHYHKDLDKSRAESAETTRKHYDKDVAKSKINSKSTTSKHYLMNIDELCKKAKHSYDLLY